MPKTSSTFESSLAELEQIVRKLEDGDLSLDESLKLFEDGVKLSRECRERLTQAERRIEVLMSDDKGNPVLEEVPTGDFDDEPPEPKIKRRVTFDDDDAPF